MHKLLGEIVKTYPRKCFRCTCSGIVIVLFGVLATPIVAQLPDSASPSDPVHLQQHPLAELQKTQPPDADEYELGSGDQISVSIIGRPELSGSHVVGPDGRITMPIFGSILVGGLSRDAASQTVAGALKRFYTDAVASIQVTKYGSNHVLVIGDIEHPGVFYFDGTPTLLEAITRGGPLNGDSKTRRMPKNCIIYRGKDQIGTINLTDVFRSGDIRLHRNDIIYIPGDQERLVSILGEVKSPGPVPLREDSTITSLLADAGGITHDAGNPNIQIINQKTGVVQTVSFKDLLKPKGKDLTLAVGDIIYVPESGIAKVGFFLQQISPAAQIGTIGALIH